MTILDDIWRYFSPSSDMGLAEFSVRKIFNEEGRPFDFLAFPHMVAPGGPMDHFDAAWCRELVMQWASRLGKTFIVLCGSLWFACLAPCNQILAGHVEDLGLQQTERIRQMGAFIPQLVDAGLENTLKKRLKFGGNTIYAAWARSPGTLSNINCLYGGASELDLWEKVSTSKHPDPQEMFGDRFKDNWTIRKEVFESIPTLKGTWVDENEKEHPRSRIEAKRLTGSDCSLWLGCPHCGCRQTLDIANVEATGYRCNECGKLIPDELRKEFVRSGVWVPRGCTVIPDAATKAAAERLDVLEKVTELDESDERLPDLRSKLYWPGFSKCGYLENPPESDGEIWSSQLSSLYALSLTWGDIHANKSTSQNFVNQWLGETMEVKSEDALDVPKEGRKLARKIISDVPRGELPDWCEYLIFSSDKQGSSYPWQVSAWNADVTRGHVVDYGAVGTLTEIERIISRKYSGAILDFAVMDCGFLEQEVYDFCLQQTQIQPFKFWPIKGDKASAVKLHFCEHKIKAGAEVSRKFKRLRRVHVNSQSTQEWMRRTLEEAKHLTLYSSGPTDHNFICQQLVNEIEIVQTGNNKWQRANGSIPNDQRDCTRYGFVGALVVQKHSRHRTPAKPVEQEATTGDGLFRMVGPSERPSLNIY